MNDRRARMAQDSIAAGTIGYLAVAVFFAVWNVSGGRSPFYTAALLGEGLLGGLQDPSLVALDPGMIIAMNGLHLFAFLLFGLFAAWLVYEVELHPDFWYLALFLFLAAIVVSYAAVLALTVLIGGLFSPALVVASSLVGAAAMAAYFARAHRPLLRFIRGSDGSGLTGGGA